MGKKLLAIGLFSALVAGCAAHGKDDGGGLAASKKLSTPGASKSAGATKNAAVKLPAKK
jgi:hypothetical protein